jgi:DnaJ homolog subfamily C member 9
MSDLKKAYTSGKGCINYMMEHVPFMSCEDEPRFHTLIDGWIKESEVPEFKAFTDEPKAKRDRRHKKYAREFKEAEKIKEKLSKNQKQSDENDLAKQIMKRGEDRAKGFGSFLDQLMDKYGDEDEDDAIDIRDLGKKVQKGKKKAQPGKAKKETPVKGGRVSKRNK